VALTDILLHIDHPASSAARIAVAVGLARRHQARLRGLLVVRHRYPLESDVLAARDLFERQVAAAGIEGHWLGLDGSALGVGTAELILAQARHSDLLIAGQGSRKAANVGVPFGLPERLVLESGLPVLVVPYAGTFPTVGERVLVAWKAGPESTRALNDALPFLQRAQVVELLAKGGLTEDETRHSLAELSGHLARHGVSARTSHLPSGSMPLGDLLLNRACDEGFDLLVLGAPARGQAGKPTLGSVASQLLRQMTIPVLMSN
jgi:nucleotide-binding universal stress UspA family protein